MDNLELNGTLDTANLSLFCIYCRGVTNNGGVSRLSCTWIISSDASI